MAYKKQPTLSITAKFKGLSPEQGHPHLYEYFTRGNVYVLRRIRGFLWVVDDKGTEIMSSWTALKKWFQILKTEK